MKTTVALALLLCAAVLSAQSGAPQNTFTPDQVKWGPAPAIPRAWGAVCGS